MDSTLSIEECLGNIDLALESVNTLNNIKGAVNGYTSPRACKIAAITVENIKHYLSMEDEFTISTEAANNDHVALENAITDFIRRIYEHIKAALKWILEKLGFEFDDEELEQSSKQISEEHVKINKIINDSKDVHYTHSSSYIDDSGITAPLDFYNKTLHVSDIIHHVKHLAELTKNAERMNAYIERYMEDANKLTIKVTETGFEDSDLETMQSLANDFNGELLSMFSQDSLNGLPSEVLARLPKTEQAIPHSVKSLSGFIYGGKIFHYVVSEGEDETDYIRSVSKIVKDNETCKIEVPNLLQIKEYIIAVEHIHDSFEDYLSKYQGVQSKLTKINESLQSSLSGMMKADANSTDDDNAYVGLNFILKFVKAMGSLVMTSGNYYRMLSDSRRHAVRVSAYFNKEASRVIQELKASN